MIILNYFKFDRTNFCPIYFLINSAEFTLPIGLTRIGDKMLLRGKEHSYVMSTIII